MEKILCSFLDDRWGKIRIYGFLGPAIPLKSGMPQGSIISPTMFIRYSSDMPQPAEGCIDVGFADDITQIITFPGKSREMLARKTKREIERINSFEKQWKIKTSRQKFQMVSISILKPNDIIINNEKIEFTRKAKLLGLTIGRTGLNSHLDQRLKQAKTQRTKLRRFRGLSDTSQVKLHKTMLRPMIEYPIVPNCIMSQSNMTKQQKFQNASLRQAARRNLNTQNENIEELHDRYKTEPINLRYFRLEKILTNSLRHHACSCPSLLGEERYVE